VSGGDAVSWPPAGGFFGRQEGDDGLVRQMVGEWEAEGVPLWPPATEAQIVSFEQRAGVILPRSFRALFQTANGMKGAYDRNLFSLWSLERIVEDGGIRRRVVPAVGRDVIDLTFGDGIFGAQYYMARFSDDGPPSILVRWSENADEDVAPDFDTFLCLYLEDPGTLYLVENADPLS